MPWIGSSDNSSTPSLTTFMFDGALAFHFWHPQDPLPSTPTSPPTGPRVRGLREHGSIVGQNLMIRAGPAKIMRLEALRITVLFRGSTHGRK